MTSCTCFDTRFHRTCKCSTVVLSQAGCAQMQVKQRQAGRQAGSAHATSSSLAVLAGGTGACCACCAGPISSCCCCSSHGMRATQLSLGMNVLSSGAACRRSAFCIMHGSSHIVPGWRLPTIACGCGTLCRCRAGPLHAQLQGWPTRLAGGIMPRPMSQLAEVPLTDARVVSQRPPATSVAQR